MGTFYKLDGESYMMYTKGIRKIITPTALNLTQAINIANASDYDAVSFNGCVYVKIDRIEWIKSPFTLEDFQTN